MKLSTTALLCVGLFISAVLPAVAMTEPEFVISEQTTTALGQTDTLVVTMHNAPQSYNVLELDLRFDPHYIQITAANIPDTICPVGFTIAENIDNIAGVLYIACGTPLPFSGATITLAEITFIAQTAGTTSVAFGLNQSVYVHDGHGTRIVGLPTPRPLTFVE